MSSQNDTKNFKKKLNHNFAKTAFRNISEKNKNQKRYSSRSHHSRKKEDFMKSRIIEKFYFYLIFFTDT